MWKLLKFVVLLFLLAPIAAWLGWYFQPKTKVNLMVMDKTVVDHQFSEHRSFFWLINQRRWIKRSGKEYDFTKDYLGFHSSAINLFEEKDLKQYKPSDYFHLLDTMDLILYADNYGVYSKDWKFHTNYAKDTIELLYGGLQNIDLNFLDCAKKKGKTILAEFNWFGARTNDDLKKRSEDMFGIKWTGWIGKYFYDLNEKRNKDLPEWVPLLYQKNYQKKYDFESGGIVLVNQNKIIVLQDRIHLKEKLPVLESFAQTQQKYHTPEKIYYPFWFDINTVDDRNEVLANFSLKVTTEGEKILIKYNIPLCFPAIMEQRSNYHFMYFSCDFSDNPIGIYSSFFYGIGKVKHMLYNADKKDDRKKFFWEYYYPFMNEVLREVEEKSKNKLNE